MTAGPSYVPQEWQVVFGTCLRLLWLQAFLSLEKRGGKPSSSYVGPACLPKESKLQGALSFADLLSGKSRCTDSFMPRQELCQSRASDSADHTPAVLTIGMVLNSPPDDECLSRSRRIPLQLDTGSVSKQPDCRAAAKEPPQRGDFAEVCVALLKSIKDIQVWKWSNSNEQSRDVCRRSAQHCCGSGTENMLMLYQFHGSHSV